MEKAEALNIKISKRMSMEQLIDAIKEAEKDLQVIKNFNICSLNMYDITSFRASPNQLIANLIYITHKFKRYCGVIPSSFLNTKVLKLTKIKWSDIMINIEHSKTLTFPKGFFIQFKKCLNISERFIFFPIIFHNNEHGHVNYMLYDQNTNEMERFEPYGYLDDDSILIPQKTDEAIVDIFKTKYGDNFIRKYYKPLSFCPYNSFQNIQELEKELTQQDPAGFCAAWVTWYIELRLSNPDMKRKQVVDLSLQKLKNNKKSFTSYIRSYSVVLKYIYKNLLQDIPIKDIFKNILHKFNI